MEIDIREKPIDEDFSINNQCECAKIRHSDGYSHIARCIVISLDRIKSHDALEISFMHLTQEEKELAFKALDKVLHENSSQVWTAEEILKEKRRAARG